MTCGKHSHSLIDLKRLTALGKALDTSQILSVFGGGFVGFGDETESEVMNHVAGRQRRSAARSRPGQRTAERSRWASGEAHHFRSDAVEAAHGAGFRILAQHYDALGFEDPNGLWVAAKSNPLGSCGPQIHFLIAFPLEPSRQIRGWAFERLGPDAKLMSLKHTNFPDASICAFLPTDNSWSIADGMTALLDHYSVWAVKKIHRDLLGTWPGKQVGPCAYYRRMEFKPSEWCGCLSGKRYRDCHLGIDLLVTEEVAIRDFMKIFRCDYETRSVPLAILDAAKKRWKTLPSMNSI